MMAWLREFASRLRHSVASTRSESRVDEEVAFHLERLVEKYRASGLSDAEARRRAALTFGGPAVAKQLAREQTRATWFEDAWRDVRLALRTLRRSPGFVVATVLTLSVGIGATTAMFSLVNSILFRPLPYPDADRLVAVKLRSASGGPEETPLSSGVYLHYLEHARSLDGLATYTERVGGFGGDDQGPSASIS